MQVWIDASSPQASIPVFGLTPTERHLRSLLRVRPTPERIVIDCGSMSPNRLAIPKILTKRLTLEFTTAEGTFRDRLARFLRDAAKHPVLLIDGAVVADARLHARIVELSHSRVVLGQGEETGAAMIFLTRVEITDEIGSASHLGDFGATLIANQKALEYRQADFDGFIRNLRRSLPFYLFRVSDGDKAAKIERFMFWSNYKGSTDIFTRYVYPPLVWILVRPLARARIHPNVVTIASIIMTFAAIPFFARGDFIVGFILAYGMSVLDSVDGKLARLTFTDSPIGNILDHGLDIVHPPLWYLSWAFGLGLSTMAWDSPLGIAAILIFVFYVLDRLILKIYPRFFGRGFHTHSRLDAMVRTVIARRNINLPVFLVGWAIGFGVETFYLITAWQALTATYHGIRTIWIIAIRKEHLSAIRGPAEIATKKKI